MSGVCQPPRRPTQIDGVRRFPGGYEPVTLTIQVQVAGACTTNVCDPVLD
jgi:hypothetical protein